MTAKIIPNYPNYTIDEKGEVRNVKLDIVMKQFYRREYASIALRNDDGRKKFMIHRLLYECFVLKDGEAMPETIDHKDVNPLNNDISNLRPATYQENNRNRLVCKTTNGGHKNIRFTKWGTFRVHINIGYYVYYTKTHPTLELAIADRDRVILEHFGAFANNGVITQSD